MFCVKIIPIVINDTNSYPLDGMDLAMIWMTAHGYLQNKQQLNIINDMVVQLAIKHGYVETIKTLLMAEADLIVNNLLKKMLTNI